MYTIVYNGINDYKLKHEKWLHFQFDTSDRPEDFIKESLPKISFRGYLISKRIKGESEIMGCHIKFLIDV